MFQRLNENKDLVIVAIASFFIGFGAASFFGDSSVADNKDTSALSNKVGIDTTLPSPFNSETAEKNVELTNGKSVVIPNTNTLVIENQRAGSSVFVKKAELSQAEWVVIRETNTNGSAGNILGAGWFPAGVHENVSVELLRGMISGERYVAMLFSDADGNKKFDHTTDAPVSDADGNSIATLFSTVASPSDL